MSSWPHPPHPVRPRPAAPSVTLAGADWLASASRSPGGIHALWADNAMAPTVLPCGKIFDVIDAPMLFGRRMLDHLWSAAGPGSGPVAAQRGRLLLFAAPGSAQRLPALLEWEEWGQRADGGRALPPLLFYGTGDAVTVPPLYPQPDGTEPTPAAVRWLLAPETRHPWLPGADALLWACVRAARAGSVPMQARG
ncbi:bifunctional DNA primase/polymerase [Streptomyces sp. NPDC026206]|uniref:bifunctional DNA primase/polymerase n=1 Tax=Streptomyces sp. NPDC026206 TaxID=3157089 RepID=UPI0033DF8184